MGGGILQLMATGAQEAHLTLNATTTLFKRIHRPITPFGVETLEMCENGQGAGWGRSVTEKLTRGGDLVGYTWAHIDVGPLTPDMWSVNLSDNYWTDYVSAGAGSGSSTVEDIIKEDFCLSWVAANGLRILKEVIFTIGGQTIDRVTSQMMLIYAELELDAGKKKTHDQMVGKVYGGNPMSLVCNGDKATSYMVPLPFWFTLEAASFLPLLALQYHDCTIQFKIEEFDKCVAVFGKSNGAFVPASAYTVKGPPPSLDICLYSDFIFLDGPERELIARQDHMYHIKQHVENYMQMPITQIGRSGTGGGTVSANLEVNLNHPAEGIVVIAQRASNLHNKDWTNLGKCNAGAGATGGDLVASHEFLLNNRAIGVKHSGKAKRLHSSFYYHQNSHDPAMPMYSTNFALRPGHTTYSGSVNMSRIDTALVRLQIELPKKEVYTDSSGASLVRYYYESTSAVAGKSFVNSSQQPEGNHDGDQILFSVLGKVWNFLVIKGGMGGTKFSN